MAEAGVESTPNPSKTCLICNVPIRFARLGVNACRACAAFYKRTTIAGKSYVCRTGTNQCVFRKHEKYMCRSCRYDKCVELGMEYRPLKLVAEIKEEEDEDCSNEPSTSSNSPELSFLEAMKIAYESSFEKRLVNELEVVVKHKLKRMDHPSEEIYVSSVHSFNDMFPTIVREVIDVFEQVFPFLKEMILEDKAAIFQEFIGKFVLIEGFFRSYTYLESNNCFYASLITCIDCENIDQWVRDEDLVERREDFRGLIRNYSAEYSALLWPLFSIDQFSQQEFMALLMLGFCGLDLSHDLPEFVFDELETIRKKVFSELQEYYKNREKLMDFSSCMGKLMTVLHSTCEAGLLMNEEYRTYAALFDIYSSDFLLREIFFQ